eukprot:m.60879 g.60879  ORF g.60879 m.60879 type:complete len:457 (+) comp13864_c0_seq1:148-1518(+)
MSDETASVLSSQDSGVATTSRPMHVVEVEDDATLTLTYLVEKTPRKGLGVAMQGSQDGFHGLYVANVPESSPCFNLLKRGDRIIKVDNFNLTRHGLKDCDVLSIIRDRFQDDSDSVRLTVARSPLAALGPACSLARDGMLVAVEQPALLPRSPERFQSTDRLSPRGSLDNNPYASPAIATSTHQESVTRASNSSQAVVLVEQSPLLSDRSDGVLMASHEICQRCEAVQVMYNLPFCARHATNPTYMQAYQQGHLQSYPSNALANSAANSSFHAQASEQAPPSYMDSLPTSPKPERPVDEHNKSAAELFLEDGQVMVRQLRLEQAKCHPSNPSSTAEVDEVADNDQPLQRLASRPVGMEPEQASETGSNDPAWEAEMLDVVFDDDGEGDQVKPDLTRMGSGTGSSNSKAWQQPVKDQLAADLMAILNEIGQDDRAGQTMTGADKDVNVFAPEDNYMF